MSALALRHSAHSYRASQKTQFSHANVLQISHHRVSVTQIALNSYTMTHHTIGTSFARNGMRCCTRDGFKDEVEASSTAAVSDCNGMRCCRLDGYRDEVQASSTAAVSDSVTNGDALLEV